MARQKSAWDKLSMRDRAQFIRLGVQNGIYDIRAIKGVYNEYHNEDSKENHDYNMAAAIATGFGPDQNKHWPDTFKKSNHPTFSVESIYSTKETPGGTWGPNFKTFEPSDWMINTYGSTPTIEYLQKYDPEVTPVYMGGVLLPEITVTANRFNNGGPLAHKKSGEGQGESSYLNKVKQSEYPILYNLLSSSRGDAKPRFMNTLGFMFNWMDKDPAIYTGNYYFGDRLGYGTKKQVPQDRNIVNLYLNGDETGFEKLDAKPIVVNGDTLQHSQYKGNILPHDTIYLHSSVKPVVEDYIQSKQLLPINNSFGTYKHTNFFDYPYNLEKYKGTTIDDANRASISFKQNTDGSYYMDVFDLWDLNGTDKNKIGVGIEKKLTSDSIDTNGPFILRQNIPIVFSEDTIGESNFLNKISGGKWKDDTVLYSTGGPLYPFSFEKNPFLKTPLVRY